jgi:hypothetical protein
MSADLGTQRIAPAARQRRLSTEWGRSADVLDALVAAAAAAAVPMRSSS